MPDVADTRTTAAYIGVPEATLRQWRYRGFGPDYVKVGQHVRYRRADLERWMDDRTVRPGGA